MLIQPFKILPFNQHCEGEYSDREIEWRRVCAIDKVSNIVALLGGQQVQSVLEVGCGTGAVLAELKKRGIGTNHQGIDIAEPGEHTDANAKNLSLAEYDGEKILGRWDFNVSTTIAMLRQARPNIPASEMRAIRAMWTQGFADTTFVAGGDGQAFLKNLPDFKNKPPTPETWKGSWTADDTNYDLSLSSNGENKSMTAQTSNGRLTLKDDKNTLIFDRED